MVLCIIAWRYAGAVPRTATLALNNATLPFVLRLANKGYKKALLEDNIFVMD